MSNMGDGTDLRFTAVKLQEDLTNLREYLVHEKDQPWFAPGCRTAMKEACSKILQAESKLQGVPYLLDHGATKKASRIIALARGLRNLARKKWLHANARESEFRFGLAKEIHEA